MINTLLLLIVVVLLLEATIWATRPARGRKAALKRSIGRPVVIPAKKETLSSRLLKSLSGLKEKVQYGGTAAVNMFSPLNRDPLRTSLVTLLLQMTSPTGSMTSQGDIDRFVATTKSYVRNGDLCRKAKRIVSHCVNCGLTERDYRTELKALYALDTLLRTCGARDCHGKLYHDLVWRLSREYSKKSGSRHFTARKPHRIRALSLLTGQCYADQQFSSAYYSYVVAGEALYK
jgi:hypothetical protein